MMHQETASAVRSAGLLKLIQCNAQTSKSNFFPYLPDDMTVELATPGLKHFRKAGVGDLKLSIVEGAGGPQKSFAK